MLVVCACPAVSAPSWLNAVPELGIGRQVYGNVFHRFAGLDYLDISRQRLTRLYVQRGIP